MENRSDKVHQHLDGEVQRGALSADEVRKAAQFERIADEAKNLHRSIETPDLTQRIMARVQAGAVSNDARGKAVVTTGLLPLIQRAWRWSWAPQSIRLRPAPSS